MNERIKFTEARFEGGYLQFKPADPEDTYAARWLGSKIQDGKKYVINVTEYRQKRSNDANAYAWVLIDKIAEKLPFLSREDVYRDHIRAIGGVSEIFAMPPGAVRKFREAWSKNGVGWQVDSAGTTPDGLENVIAYYGSSTFDTAQMSRFIDSLIQDAKALDIETMPPDKLEGLLNSWTEKHASYADETARRIR